MDTVSVPTWWGRNWKWAAPLLGTALLAVVAAGFIGIFSLVMHAMKSTVAYQQAVARAADDPTVIAALGQPIRPAFFVSGNFTTDGSRGHADFAIPLHGPKGNATVYVQAKEALGAWTYSTLTVQIGHDKPRIDLLHP